MESCFVYVPLCITAIKRGSLKIVCNNSNRLKISFPFNRFGKQCYVGTYIRHGHIGHLSHDDRPLRRVVIDKNYAVQSYVQFPCNFANVIGLRLPVSAEGTEIIEGQEHIRMSKTLLCSFRVVLRTNCEEYSAFPQLFNVALKVVVRLADGMISAEQQAL